MELLSAIIKEYNGSLNISMEVNLLQQLLPELVSLEQMLKQKENTNASTGECSRVNKELGSLKNSRWKYSRLKQKVALIEKQYKNHPKRLIVQLIRFVNRFTKLAKLTNFSSGHVPIHQNGMVICIPIYLLSKCQNLTDCSYEKLND